MVLTIGTHSGHFHADDVLAVALLREFVDADAEVVRTRDAERLAACDAVVDVGGIFDPTTRRFDHHQVDYEGPLSSAGMVLDWLAAEDHIYAHLADRMRGAFVDYVDAVDNGRTTPTAGLPCFTQIIGAFVQDLGNGGDMDDRFLEAVAFAQRYVRGMRAGYEEIQRVKSTVRKAMKRAAKAKVRTLILPGYMPWKSAYFESGGRTHPTDFVVFPAEGAWRIMAIPPEPGSFDNKVPLPAEWAGLTDADLEKVTGIPGARFCHKNRFIAVFATREGVVQALRSAFGDRWVPLDDDR